MTKQRAAANTARHILKYRLRSGFDFDDVIKRLAVRARKGIERRRSATSHDTPLYTIPADLKDQTRRTHHVPMGRHSRAADTLEANTRHALKRPKQKGRAEAAPEIADAWRLVHFRWFRKIWVRLLRECRKDVVVPSC
jgi:hypothetical protein